MGFLDYLMFWKKPAQQVMPLDDERIESNEIIKGQQKKIASHEGTIGSLLAEKRLEKAKEKSKEKEKELIYKLRQRERELQQKRLGKPLGLSSFLKIAKKMKGELKITDKEGKEFLGYFGDLKIVEDGYLSVYDIEGNMICMGVQLTHVIYKADPQVLRNYIETKQIRIPFILDEKGKLQPYNDPDNVETPKITHTGREGVYETTHEVYQKVKHQIVQKNEEVKELRKKLELTEQTIIKLTSELDAANMAYDQMKTLAETRQSKVSESLESVKQIVLHGGQIERENAILIKSQAMIEQHLVNAEAMVKEVMSKLRSKGILTEHEQALSNVIDLMENLRNFMPKQVVIHQEAEKKEVATAHPGQRIS